MGGDASTRLTIAYDERDVPRDAIWGLSMSVVGAVVRWLAFTVPRLP